MTDYDENVVSDFNMSVSYLNRLNQILLFCDDARIRIDIYTWFHNIIALYSELSPEFNVNEMINIENQFKDLFPKIDKFKLGSAKGKNISVDPNIYWQLHDIEVTLRKRMDKKGLQIKKSSDALRLIK